MTAPPDPLRAFDAAEIASGASGIAGSENRATSGGAARGVGSSLSAILTLTFLASISTGAVNNGVYFIAKEQYSYGRELNLWLALLIGGVYVPGALAVGPALRRLAARSDRVTTRRVLIAMMISMAVLCALPVMHRAPWMIWLFAALYVPLMGALWPIVEAYLSGGRRGDQLRRAIGSFNLVWATAVAVAAWAMAPLLEFGRPLAILLSLGLIHLLCLAPVARLTPEPRRHLDEVHTPHPVNYAALLHSFRWLLILSYILLAVINPIMPWRLSALGLGIGWQPVLLSVWMVSRVGMFLLLHSWGGWHGRWRTPIWSGGLMLAGFIGVLFSGGTLGMSVSLSIFGIGIGTIYAAALYYAMEVGAAEVDAGGKHEAMIGMGYTIGPALGLAAVFLTRGAKAEDAAFSSTLAALTLVVAGLFVIGTIWSARRAMRRL